MPAPETNKLTIIGMASATAGVGLMMADTIATAVISDIKYPETISREEIDPSRRYVAEVEGKILHLTRIGDFQNREGLGSEQRYKDALVKVLDSDRIKKNREGFKNETTLLSTSNTDRTGGYLLLTVAGLVGFAVGLTKMSNPVGNIRKAQV